MPNPYSDFETRIARRDFRDITKDVLPTPCMVVDLALFNQNVKKMAEQVKSTNIHVRPHVKIHKSVDVARRQIAQGAIGVTCATIAEAELMSGGGIKHVLWTKQPASLNNISRAVALSKKDHTFVPTSSWTRPTSPSEPRRRKLLLRFQWLTHGADRIVDVWHIMGRGGAAQR